jgi:DNA-binding response OmpR family regulator
MSATILIVEDNIVTLKTLNAIVSQKYTTILAKDGKEALDIIKHRDLDLILLDIMIPKIDGLSLSEIIKDDDGLLSTPIIFVTGLDSEDIEVDGLKCSEIDCITKPFTGEQIMSAIEKNLKSD